MPKVFRPQNGYFVLNTFFLIAIALLPASKDECFYSSLSKNLKNEQKLYVDDANFKLEMTFLNDRKISLKGEHPNSSSNFYFLTTNVESFENYLKNPNCNLRYSTYSKFVLDFLPKKIKDRSSILALFYCSVL